VVVIPDEFLGCGIPVGLSSVRAGETVLTAILPRTAHVWNGDYAVMIGPFIEGTMTIITSIGGESL
jgi:hypothetical protein